MNRLTGARVDFEKRMIFGIVVMTVGKAFGHCAVDATTLQQFKGCVGEEKVRGRENHPDEGITQRVEDLRGFFFNCRIEGEKLLADFQAYSEDAAGKEPTKLLHKASEAPEIFGVSPVFFGNPEGGMARVSKVVAIDFVDIPAGDDANQQLFKGANKMAALVAENREGKFYVKCGAEEYEVAFPPDQKKEEMSAEEEKKKAELKAKFDADEAEKKKAEMAASEGDPAATAKDLTKAGAKAYSAVDLSNAKDEGRKEAIKYASEFDATMDAAGIAGKDREEFRKTHFAKGEKFGIEYVKELAGEVMKLRAKAVGEGGAGTDGSGESAEAVAKSDDDKAALQRFSAHADLRRGWMKDADSAFINKPESQQYKAAAVKFIKSRQNAGK